MKRQINSEKLNDLYTLIGRAVWHFQYFEDLLVTFVSMKCKIPRKISLKEAEQILEKERKKTLGKLIKDAGAGEIIPETYQERFDKILNDRNWLIHRLWKENGEDLYHNKKRQELINKINDVYEESIQLKMILFEIFLKWCEEQGLDNTRVNQMAHEKIAKLKGS